MYRLWSSPDAIRCPCCASPSNLLGTADTSKGRVLHHCQCRDCLLSFDRIIAPNGQGGATVLYAVPSSQRARPAVRVVPAASQEGAHAS